MTKERKLAIKMWTDIRNMLSISDGKSPKDITNYKAMFCEDHNLKWQNDCWFCQYINDCVKCPLHCCDFGSYYMLTKDIYLSTFIRIEACDYIIKALGGEA